MCRSDREEWAAGTLFACCGAVAMAAVLMAGAFHIGVKRQAYGEGQRCVDTAVARGWVKPAPRVLRDTGIVGRSYKPSLIVTSKAVGTP